MNKNLQILGIIIFGLIVYILMLTYYNLKNLGLLSVLAYNLLGIFIIIIVLNKKKNIFSKVFDIRLIFVFSMMFWFNFGILENLFITYPNIDNKLIGYTNSLFVLSLFSSALGFISVMSLTPQKAIKKNNNYRMIFYPNETNLIVLYKFGIFVLIVGCGCLITKYIIQYGSIEAFIFGSYASNVENTINTNLLQNICHKMLRLIYVGFAIIFYVIINREAKQKYWIFLVIPLLIITISGSRSKLLYFGFIAGSIFVFNFRNLSQKKTYRLNKGLYYLIVICVFFMLYQTFFRTKFDISNININVLLRGIFGSYTHCLKVMEVFPDKYEFWYGNSFLQVLINIIPRALWDSKPIGFGAFVAREIYGMPNTVSYATTLVGELYANFGYFGTIISFYIISLIISYIHYKYAVSYRNGETFWWFSGFSYGLISYSIFFVVRGDILSGIFTPLFILILGALLDILLKKYALKK